MKGPRARPLQRGTGRSPKVSIHRQNSACIVNDRIPPPARTLPRFEHRRVVPLRREAPGVGMPVSSKNWCVDSLSRNRPTFSLGVPQRSRAPRASAPDAATTRVGGMSLAHLHNSPLEIAKVRQRPGFPCVKSKVLVTEMVDCVDFVSGSMRRLCNMAGGKPGHKDPASS